MTTRNFAQTRCTQAAEQWLRKGDGLRKGQSHITPRLGHETWRDTILHA